MTQFFFAENDTSGFLDHPFTICPSGAAINILFPVTHTATATSRIAFNVIFESDSARNRDRRLNRSSRYGHHDHLING